MRRRASASVALGRYAGKNEPRRTGALTTILRLSTIGGSRCGFVTGVFSVSCRHERKPCRSPHPRFVRGGSSVGRALRSQCRGRGFNSLPLHFLSRFATTTYSIASVIPFEGFIEVIPFVIPSEIPLGDLREKIRLISKPVCRLKSLVSCACKKRRD